MPTLLNRFKHWHALRLFDKLDARGHQHWKIRVRRWGYQLMRQSTPDFW